jgi:proline iminopeptidase
MRLGLALAALTASSAAFPSIAADAQDPTEFAVAAEGQVSLYARTIGSGPPTIVLHGGPDFDHAYLLPDLDRLADVVQLIYYDQRGRGRSADGVVAQDVTIASEMEDIERIRQHFGKKPVVLFGHSWGTVLALEYALRYPAHVSALILMNPAPASTSDVALLRTAYLKKLGTSLAEQQRSLLAGKAYQSGDPEAVAARYRIHFTPALVRREHYEQLMTAMKAQFIKQGNSGILKARAVEDQLMSVTWQVPDYDLLPKLSSLRVPILVITGESDFIPVSISEHIAERVPDAELIVLKECGHFAYLEDRENVHETVSRFIEKMRQPVMDRLDD